MRWPRWMPRVFLILLAVVLIVVIAAWQLGWLKPRDLLSPLSRLGYITFVSEESQNHPKEVLGYLPYWTMDKASLSAELTDVAYFAIAFSGNGDLVESMDGSAEPGLRRLQRDSFPEWLRERHAQDMRVHITITGNGQEAIETLMTSHMARANMVNTLKQLLVSYPLDGVQLDFEYGGNASEAVREGYVLLVRDVNTMMEDLNSDLVLSVATFASAAGDDTLFWDVDALAPHVDFFVVMAYDYHLRSSPVVGPVAPIFGRGEGRWRNDVVSNIRAFLLKVPANKIMLGIPLYGYEWTATSDEQGATTYPGSGSTATYERVMELLNDPQQKVEERWDEDALAPYLVYEENGKQQFIYYENTRSLAYKLDLVQQLDLRGIAVWALGYEGGFNEVWHVVGQRLRTL